MIGNHTDALADPGPPHTPRHIHLGVLLGELGDHCIGIFDDVTVTAVWCGATKVARERLRASVENDLAVHRVADDGAENRGGTVGERAEAAADGVHVVIDGRPGTDFRDLRHEVRPVGGRCGSARHDVPAETVAIEEIDRHIVGPIMNSLERFPECRILIEPDHRTTLRTRAHSYGAVPFALAGYGIKPNGATSYNEVSALATGLLVDPGHGLMERALNPGGF